MIIQFPNTSLVKHWQCTIISGLVMITHAHYACGLAWAGRVQVEAVVQQSLERRGRDCTGWLLARL